MAASSMHFDSSADFTLIGAIKQILIDNVCIASLIPLHMSISTTDMHGLEFVVKSMFYFKFS
jgi:hypothetical protein